MAGWRYDPYLERPKEQSLKAVSEFLVSQSGLDISNQGALKTGFSQVSFGSNVDVAAAGNPDITDQLLKGVKLGDKTDKNHLDGYNQLDLINGKGPSVRHEIFYFEGSNLGALRVDDFKFQFFQQPNGWAGEKLTTNMPTIINIRQDPFERTPDIRQESMSESAGGYMNDFYSREFWRFVMVQKLVGDLAKTAVEFPPMQASASFNLSAIKAKIDDIQRAHEGQ